MSETVMGITIFRRKGGKWRTASAVAKVGLGFST